MLLINYLKNTTTKKQFQLHWALDKGSSNSTEYSLNVTVLMHSHRLIVIH